MKKKAIVWGMILAAVSAASAANSASVVSGSLVQGDVAAAMKKGSSTYQGGYGEETSNLSDWNLHMGEFSWSPGVYGAISTTNANINAYSDSWGSYGSVTDSIIAFGNGGSVTLKLDNVIGDVAGQKEFGLFTAQMLDAYGTPGSYWNGHMESAVLVSQNGIDWVTLDGMSVSQSYTGTSYYLNAPTVGYNYQTLQTAWSYGTGATGAQLAALATVDYAIPMVDDSLFNDSASTDAMRAAMALDGTLAGYADVFGTSGGGNWFDLSGCGLDTVGYIQLNGVNCAPEMGVRLDAVFTTDAAVVPEPATILLLGWGVLFFGRRKK
jgi:hypothetical protein